MTLVAGTKLGPYEIQSPIGAGGMGEVYRALDTRLDRTVAVKILPPHLSANPEAKQRFDREARAISSLNHPNICQLYDVGQQNGIDFLVMEFLEGETLGDRLAKGALPAEQVLRYGIEICQGLERAHKSGVIHRDLKPGNIMLTKAGAKLMDFGLAKSTVSSAPPSSSMTIALEPSTQPLTEKGMVVGTFQYMSPEQIEGKEADERSDIFALGAVLYEMTTGKRAFTGKSQASLVAAILASEPEPISRVQPMSPPALERIVKVCLAKDPDERFQNIHDVGMQLQWVREGGSQANIPAPVRAQKKNRERLLFASLVALALLAVISIVSALHYSQKADSLHRTIRAQISAPEQYSFTDLLIGGNQAVVSPDGSKITFIAEKDGKKFLWVRSLDGITLKMLDGTEGAENPFWSPDSKFLGFFAFAKLQKVEASGGVVQALADAPFGRGGAWNKDGVILFTPQIHDAIYRIPSSGGTATAVTKITNPGPLAGHRWPYFLPDGQHFLFTASDANQIKASIYLSSLNPMDAKLVVDAASNAVFANGYLFFVRDRNLIAQPFDPGSGSLKGSPVPVSPKLDYSETKGKGNFSVSNNGILVYRAAFSVASSFVWLDRDGKQLGNLGESGFYSFARLSPDGRTVSLSRQDTTDQNKTDVWLMDAQRGSISRLTFSPTIQTTSAWSPDSSRLVVASVNTELKVFPIRTGGSTETLKGDALFRVDDWTNDGKTLLVASQTSTTGWDVLSLSSSGGSAKPLLNSAFNEGTAHLSPDNRWLAYSSNESGRTEIYVVPFPGTGGRWQISNNGAATLGGAYWAHDGRTLYYQDAAGNLMSASVDGKTTDLQPSPPRQIFSAPGGVVPVGTALDGRVLVLVRSDAQSSPPITLVVNWDAELNQ